MKKNLLLICCLITSSAAFAQKQNKTYQYSTDLTGLKEDKLLVELITPKVKTDEIEFQMPKMVPGTYAIYDFGRLLSDFKAFDEKGTPLTVARLDSNRWKIKDAKKLYKISYNVEDSFDSKLSNMMFEPAGTNFEPNENFVLNTFGIFGYLENMKEIPFDKMVSEVQKYILSESYHDNLKKPYLFSFLNFFHLQELDHIKEFFLLYYPMSIHLLFPILFENDCSKFPG